MKIGLILFGHLRSYRQTLASFNKLKETLQESGQVDIFCHTWNIEESVTASWWKEHKPDDPPPATVHDEQIENSYNPAKYIIEPSRKFDDSGYNIQSSIPIAGTMSMLHSQYEAYRLLKEYESRKGIQYDVIVKTRYDLLYEIAPGFSDVTNYCAIDQHLYLPSSNPYELLGSGSDVFAIGDRKSIEKYFDFCVNFKEAVSYYINKGYSQFLPELCMSEYLKKIGLKERVLTGLRLHILRMNGDKFHINSDKNFSKNAPLCFYKGTIELCSKIIPADPNVIKENSAGLVKRYMSWIDPGADEKMLDLYSAFYNGKWIGISKIKRLAKLGKSTKLFTNNVMKNYFEEALHKANYSTPNKLLFVSTLSVYAGYGLFFFRVLKNLLSRESV